MHKTKILILFFLIVMFYISTANAQMMRRYRVTRYWQYRTATTCTTCQPAQSVPEENTEFIETEATVPYEIICDDETCEIVPFEEDIEIKETLGSYEITFLTSEGCGPCDQAQKEFSGKLKNNRFEGLPFFFRSWKQEPLIIKEQKITTYPTIIIIDKTVQENPIIVDKFSGFKSLKDLREKVRDRIRTHVQTKRLIRNEILNDL